MGGLGPQGSICGFPEGIHGNARELQRLRHALASRAPSSRGPAVKLYLVNPLFERSIWSFPGLRAFTGARFFSTPLGLATIAALTPPHWDIEIADENVESIDFDSD